MADVAYLKSDNLLVLEGLRDELEDLKGNDPWVNNATVEVTLYEPDETTEIAGQSWPATMQHVSGSDGDYYLTLKESLDVADFDKVIAVLKADAGGVTRRFEKEIRFKDA